MTNKNIESTKKDFVVAVSGYFDPPHEGHIEYFKKAKELALQLGGEGARLVVIINNENQSRIKYPERGHVLPIKTRIAIIKELRCVDDMFISIDDDSSVKKSLEKLRPNVFAKGGDKFNSGIPEREVCEKLGIRLIDGLGEKIQSSSALVERMKEK